MSIEKCPKVDEFWITWEVIFEKTYLGQIFFILLKKLIEIWSFAIKNLIALLYFTKLNEASSKLTRNKITVARASCSLWNFELNFQLPLRVGKAVECEKLVASILHPDLKHSTSCRDVTSSFYHIKDLWNQMGWHEVHNNRSLLAASVDVSIFSIFLS